MSGNAAGPGYGLGTASMDADIALLLSTSLNGTGDSSSTDRALLSTQPAATAGGFAVPAAAARPPRQLGFAVQSNSSVQWFKGQYQNPNTYIQVSCCGVCWKEHCERPPQQGSVLEGCGNGVPAVSHTAACSSALGHVSFPHLVDWLTPPAASHPRTVERSCPCKWRLSAKL